MLKILVISLIYLIALGDTTPLSLSKTLKIMKKDIAKYLSFSKNHYSERKTINNQTNLTNIGHDIPPETIVDGYPINIEKVPWQVALLSVPDGYFPFCGGSIITEYWVLTAANCLCYETGIKIRKENIAIASGSERYDKLSTWNKVKKINCHRYFRPSGIYDIALLQVVNEFEFNVSFRWPIQLSIKSAESYTQHVAYVSGWGSIYNNGTSKTSTLQGSELRIMSNQDCNNKLRDHRQGPLKLGEMCLVSDYDAKICFGDIGGPATIFDSNHRTVQIGILVKMWPGTDGRPCGPEAIIVCTDVSKYNHFIDDTIFI